MKGMEQSAGMKGLTDMAIMSFLSPNASAEPNIADLKAAVHTLCKMAAQKTAGQRNPFSGRRYAPRDVDVAVNLERVKFTIICEAVLLVLSGEAGQIGRFAITNFGKRLSPLPTAMKVMRSL